MHALAAIFAVPIFTPRSSVNAPGPHAVMHGVSSQEMHAVREARISGVPSAGPPSTCVMLVSCQSFSRGRRR